MPEYLSPNVYVEEVDTGSKPIEGVSTSTSAMVGVTERGPLNVPILITGVGEFRRWFGDLLSDAEFSNASGFHCYLPHAAQGFFTNGGKRVYVTRILRDDARRSALSLFDRGTPASVTTMLLRAAPQGTGTAVNGPLVSVLVTALGVNDWIRIGDGSQAEYHRIVNTGASSHIALAFPLAQAHDANAVVRNIAVVRLAAFTADLLATAAVPAGATQLVVQEGAAGEAAAIAAGQSIQIGTAPNVEHKTITFVAGAGTTRTITLDTPLVRAYSPAPTVVPLAVAGADLHLVTTAAPGDIVIFRDSSGALANPLVVIDPGQPQQEVRRIGQLHSLPLTRRTYADYARGSQVTHVTVQDDDRTIVAPALPLTGAGTAATPITLNRVDGLAPGQLVVVGPLTAAAEPRVIRTVAPAPLNQVTFTAALGNVHTSTAMAVGGKQLSAAAAAGDVSLALNNRLGLAVGNVLHVDVAPDDEYVTVAALTGDPGAPPDAGALVLTAPLRHAHALNAPVRRQIVAPPAVVTQPAFLVLPAAADDATLFVSENFAFNAGDVVRVTTPDGDFFHGLSGAAAALAPEEIELDAPLLRSHEAGAPVVQRTALIQIQALDPGRWGDRLRISVEDERDGLVAGATLDAVNSPIEILLSSPTGVEPGTVLELRAPDGTLRPPLIKVEAINRANNRMTLAGPLSGLQMAAVGGRVRSREFRLTVLLMRRPDPATPSRDDTVIDSEMFINLSMDPRHSRYFARIIGDVNGPLRREDRRPEGSSWYVRAADLEGAAANREGVRLGPETLVDILPSGRARPARHALTDGGDSIPLLDDTTYIGVDAVDPDDRTGLQTFKNVEEISIVAAPGRTGPDLQGALIAHCEEMRYRFVVLDGPRAPNDSIADVRFQRQQFDTKYAALYHPWLLVPPPYPTTPAPATYLIPPAGHVVGIYARTDIERGVHKAPANEVVRGVLGLQRTLSKGEHDILNPSPVNINVIRDFRPNNRGIRVWGGRVITSDSDWKYVNVRRLLIFIEHSIDRGLQWVVFEPNAEPLWARVRRTISNFLTVVWRNGALEGMKVEEAFFVKCDRTTMTQTDIDSGRLICHVGVAPVKPAEFVIIQIGLWTAHAED